MRPIATDGVERSVCRSVHLSVCHDRQPHNRSWTDRDAVRNDDTDGHKEPCIISWQSKYAYPMRRAILSGKSGRTRTRPYNVRRSKYSKRLSTSQHNVLCRCQLRVLDWVHIAGTWRIRLKHKPFVCGGDATLFQILEPLVTIGYWCLPAALRAAHRAGI